MYDKSTGEWVPTHASNAAVRSDFYTVDLIGEGASDEVEQALGSMEGRMITALRHIDEGKWPPDEEDRQATADFVGLQSVRGVDFRDSIQQSDDRVGRKIADVIAATGAGLRAAFREEHGRDASDQELEELKQAVTRMDVRADIPRNYHVVLMLHYASLRGAATPEARALSHPGLVPFGNDAVECWSPGRERELVSLLIEDALGVDAGGWPGVCETGKGVLHHNGRRGIYHGHIAVLNPWVISDPRLQEPSSKRDGEPRMSL
jgi:hypothetical protein